MRSISRRIILYFTISHAILAIATAFSIYKVVDITNRSEDFIINECIDEKGNLAYRLQNSRLDDVFTRFNRQEITPEQAQKEFINVYRIANQEAGPTPPCLED